MMKYLSDVAQVVGLAIDKLVPIGVGSRTKVAVIACPALSLAAPILGSIPQAAPFMLLIPALQHALCAAAPAFALASLVREK